MVFLVTECSLKYEYFLIQVLGWGKAELGEDKTEGVAYRY